MQKNKGCTETDKKVKKGQNDGRSRGGVEGGRVIGRIVPLPSRGEVRWELLLLLLLVVLLLWRLEGLEAGYRTHTHTHLGI